MLRLADLQVAPLGPSTKLLAFSEMETLSHRVRAELGWNRAAVSRTLHVLLMLALAGIGGLTRHFTSSYSIACELQRYKGHAGVN